MDIMLRMRALPAGFIAPCLPTKTDKLPSGSQWLHEIKHDGFRVIARKDGNRVRGPPAAHALSAALWSSNRCQQNQRFAQTIALCRGAGREHAENMLESTVSFPAIFFAAIIGVIIFIALSELLLDPHE